MTNIIKFLSNKPWLDSFSISAPSPTSKTIPDWYKNSSKYAKDKDGNTIIDNSLESKNEKVLGWKSCPALLDIMTTGYVLKTPCDIEFYKDSDNIIKHKILDKKYSDFCSFRAEMSEFEYPKGYAKNHFAWFADWSISLPKGYSALYCHPINRFELPFLTVGGIIDSDKTVGTGNMPFFILENFVGIIKSGTPYMQVIPFKRENWKSEFIEQKTNEIFNRRSQNGNMYRKPGGGVYKSKIWQPRKYE